MDNRTADNPIADTRYCRVINGDGFVYVLTPMLEKRLGKDLIECEANGRIIGRLPADERQATTEAPKPKRDWTLTDAQLDTATKLQLVKFADTLGLGLNNKLTDGEMASAIRRHVAEKKAEADEMLGVRKVPGTPVRDASATPVASTIAAVAGDDDAEPVPATVTDADPEAVIAEQKEAEEAAVAGLPEGFLTESELNSLGRPVLYAKALKLGVRLNARTQTRDELVTAIREFQANAGK